MKRYCTPTEPACDAAVIVWMEPWIHWNVHGDVQATLSTVSRLPVGELVTVMLDCVSRVCCAPIVKKAAGAL